MSAQFPIADAHQHFWDPRANYHPWLCDQPPVAFRYGDYAALCRPYLPADYFADAGGHEVVKTVYVETEWDPRDPLGETAWVERLRSETGFPTVMVTQAWLDRDDIAGRFTHMGPAGAGMAAKMLNQLIVGCGHAVMAEAVVLAEAAGIDAARVRAAGLRAPAAQGPGNGA